MKQLTEATKKELSVLLASIKAEISKQYSCPVYVAEKLRSIERKIKLNY